MPDARPPRSGPLVVTTVLLTIAVLGIGVVASLPPTPLSRPHLPGIGGLSPFARVAELLGMDGLGARSLIAIFLALVVVASGAFIYAARKAWKEMLDIRRVVAVAVFLHVLVVCVPALFPSDAYYYITYGRMVSEHGANPYVSPPSQFADDPAYPYISGKEQTSVYGPAFTALSAGVTSLDLSTESSLLIFKVLSGAASLGAMGLVIAAARRVKPERATFAAVLMGLNPVILFHGVFAAHNDVLVMLALAAAVYLLVVRRTMAAVAVLALGAALKVVVLLPLFIVLAAVVANSVGGRLKALARHVGIALVVGLPFVIPFFHLDNPTFGVLGAGGRYSGGSAAVRDLTDAIGLEALQDPLALVAQLGPPLLTLAVLGALMYLMFRADASAPNVAAAMGWSVFFMVLTTPDFAAWYLLWIVPFGWLLPRVPRTGLLAAIALASVDHPYTGLTAPWGKWLIYALALGSMLLLAVLSVDLFRRLRDRSGERIRNALVRERAGELAFQSSSD